MPMLYKTHISSEHASNSEERENKQCDRVGHSNDRQEIRLLLEHQDNLSRPRLGLRRCFHTPQRIPLKNGLLSKATRTQDKSEENKPPSSTSIANAFSPKVESIYSPSIRAPYRPDVSSSKPKASTTFLVGLNPVLIRVSIDDLRRYSVSFRKTQYEQIRTLFQLTRFYHQSFLVPISSGLTVIRIQLVFMRTRGLTIKVARERRMNPLIDGSRVHRNNI